MYLTKAKAYRKIEIYKKKKKGKKCVKVEKK